MRHNNIFKTITAALFLGLIGIVTACSNGLVEEIQTQTQILPVLGKSARTVFPEFDADELYGIKLEAKENGSEDDFIELGIWDNVDTISAIDIKPGIYNFRLTAYQGEVSFVSTKPRQVIEKDKLNPIAFNLRVNEWGAVDSTGNIDIKVRWSADVKAISNSLTLYDVDTDGVETAKYSDSNVKVYYDNDSKDGGWYIDYTKYDLPVGEYKFEFSVTDENYKQGFYSDYIVVAADCTSSNTFEIENWSDMYAVASMAYSNQSEHVTAVPDPDGNGIKITVSYKEGDPTYWTDIRIRETVANIKKTYSIWSAKDNNPENMLGKDGLQEISYVYPFVEDGENYIFNIEMWGGEEVESYAVYEIENVVTKAKGGDSSVLDADYKSKIQAAGITLGTVGASMKLKTDLTKLFTDYTTLKSLSLDYRFHSGEKSESGRNWTGVYHNNYCNLFDTVGMAEYRNLIDKDSDGIYVTSEEALDALKENSVYFATVDLYFSTDNNSGSYEISLQSEETPYTIAQMNKISFVIDADTTKTYLYPSNTKVTFTNPVRDGFICDGIYKNSDYSGTPITGLSRAENISDITLYPKWNILFSVLNKDLPNINKTNMMVRDLDADFDQTLKTGDKVALSLTGKANMDFEASVRFQVFGKDKYTHRGDGSAYLVLKKGEEFTALFGVTINDAEVEDKDIAPEDLFIQLEYDRTTFYDQLVVSDYEIKFESDPVEYTYVLSQIQSDGKFTETENGYFVKDVVKNLPVPTKYGFKFAGWYEDADYTGSALTCVAATDNESKTLYAKWNISLCSYNEQFDEHITYFKISDYLPGYSSDIALKSDSSTYVILELTGTSNIDFNGSIGSFIVGSNAEKTRGVYFPEYDVQKTVDGQPSNHITIDKIKAGVPFALEIPLFFFNDEKNSEKVEDGEVITADSQNVFFGYWDEDCSQIMEISDWNIEVKPAVQVAFNLDDDRWLWNDFEFKAENSNSVIKKYYVQNSTTPVALPTDASRNGYSRKFEGWYADSGLTDGPHTTYIPSENKDFYAKWSLVFTEGSYINGTDNSIHYNYGTRLDLNSFAYWQDKAPDSEGNLYGNKPDLKNGDHVTIVLKGTPTANTDINDYTIGGQLWDNNTGVPINDFHTHSKVVKDEPIELVYDFDVNWTTEVNYEDLSIGFVYDTGKTRAHADGTGLIFSDYTISYKVSSDKVAVTYDYGFGTETEYVYKDSWFTLNDPEASDMYDGRVFQGWYEDSDYSGDRVYSTSLNSAKTYYAKWDYKLAEGRYIDQYVQEDGTPGQYYHQMQFTYETRISNREVINTLGYTEENMPSGQYWVLVMMGVSDSDIGGIYGQMVMGENYYGDYSNLVSLKKNDPFKAVYQIKLDKSYEFDDSDASIDIQIGRGSVKWNETEPVLTDVSYELYGFATEAEANAKFTELKPVVIDIDLDSFTLAEVYGEQDKTKITNYSYFHEITSQTGLLKKYDEINFAFDGVSDVDVPVIYMCVYDGSEAANGWKVLSDGCLVFAENVKAGQKFTINKTIKLVEDSVEDVHVQLFAEPGLGKAAHLNLPYADSGNAADGTSLTTLPAACTLVVDTDYAKATPVALTGASAEIVTFENEECIRVSKNDSGEIRVMWKFDTPISAADLSKLSISVAGISLENCPTRGNIYLIYDDEPEATEDTPNPEHGSAAYAFNSETHSFVENTINLKTQYVAWWDATMDTSKKITGIQIWCNMENCTALFFKDIKLE